MTITPAGFKREFARRAARKDGVDPAGVGAAGTAADGDARRAYRSGMMDPPDRARGPRRREKHHDWLRADADFVQGMAPPRAYVAPMHGIRDTTGMTVIDAREDFRRARRRHKLSHVLGGRGTAALRELPASATLGVGRAQTAVVPVDCIVGTVEPAPGFDERFRPASEVTRARWERVARAHRTGAALPPIEVVKQPDGFYVLDGRHRVSVAREFGQTHIDALVIGAAGPGALAA
jgi:hypothetical protein